MTIIGTPAYMSPEQVNGDRQLDGRSDIYALGVIVFEMLTGRPPYEADTPAKLMFKHVHEPVPNILAVQPDLPPMCQEVIARAMAKAPTARFERAVRLSQSLSQALPGLSVQAVVKPEQIGTEEGQTAELFDEEASTNPLSQSSQKGPVEAPFFSRETIADLLAGNSKTLGVAIIILIVLLCGGMLLVPSIWSFLF
jgi:serine/threonine protein kinase